MFSSLFSSKSREVVDHNTKQSSGLSSWMRNVASKASMILTLAAGSNIAISAPTAPDLPSHDTTETISAPSPENTAAIITSEATLPPKAPDLPDQKITPIEPLSVQPKLRMAVVQKGESVGLFMLKNFGTQEGWQGRLISKQTGKIIRIAETDLIAGETVVFARDYKEANNLSTIFMKQVAKKNGSVQTKDISKSVIEPQAIKSKMPSMTWNGGVTSGKELVEKARNFLDMAYGIGGNGNGKIDCSGLLNQSMRLAGVVQQSFPRLTSGHYKNIIEKMGRKDYRDVTAGDLIYTPPQRKGGYGHIRMASGPIMNGKIPVIHASGSHKKVVENLVSYTSDMLIGTPPWVASSWVYAQAAGMDYASVAQKTPEVEIRKHESPAIMVVSTEKKVPKTLVATTSANDDSFKVSENKLEIVTVDGVIVREPKSDTIEMKTAVAHPEMIELVSVGGEVTNVVASIEQEHKAEVMEKLRNDKTIREDVRRSVLAKLEKVTDFRAYYQQNIKHYEMEARKGSAYAKKVLPDLYKLLHDVELKTTSGNDANVAMKKRA